MKGQWGPPKSGRLLGPLRAHQTTWFLTAALALGIVLRLRMLSVPFERDEGEYAYAGQLMLQGIAPYDLAYTMKLPGVPAVYALMMLLFGQTHTGIHLGLLLINCLTAVLIFAVGKRLIGRLAGVCAAAFFTVSSTLPAVQGLWANSEHFVLPFAMAGILAFLHWQADRRDRFLFVAGALLGCAVLMKQHGAAFLAFVAICLSFEMFVSRTGTWGPVLRPAASFIAGAAAPIALMALVVYAMGSFDKFLYWTAQYATTYTTGNDLERGWFNFVRKAGPLWRQASAIGFMAAVAPLCLDWSPTKRDASTRVCLFALLSFLAICPGLFFRPHYFVLLLPAAALLAGASLDRAHRLLSAWTRKGWVRAVPALLGIAIVGATVLTNQQVLIHSTPAQVLRSTYGINPFSEAVEVGQWLQSNTREDETIAVIGSEPQIYFYAQRKSATGYIYTYPLMADQPQAEHMQREMAKEIEAAAPRFLVYVHDASSWSLTKRSVTAIFDWFWNYQTQYQIVGWSEATAESSAVYWGTPADWPPKSPGWMAIYQRIGANKASER